MNGAVGEPGRYSDRGISNDPDLQVGQGDTSVKASGLGAGILLP